MHTSPIFETEALQKSNKASTCAIAFFFFFALLSSVFLVFAPRSPKISSTDVVSEAFFFVGVESFFLGAGLPNKSASLIIALAFFDGVFLLCAGGIIPRMSSTFMLELTEDFFAEEEDDD